MTMRGRLPGTFEGRVRFFSISGNDYGDWIFSMEEYNNGVRVSGVQQTISYGRLVRWINNKQAMRNMCEYIKETMIKGLDGY